MRLSDILVWLITVLVGAAVVWAFYARRHVGSWRRPPGGRLADGSLGLAELTLPSGWRAASSLNDSAGIEAIDPRIGRYAIVFSDGREDFEDGGDLDSHSAVTRKTLAGSVRVVSVRGPEYRTISGFPAVQYELDAIHDGTVVTYLHTTVAGRRAYHQVLCWATRSRYSRQVFNNIVEGFRERDGPDPTPVPPSSPPMPPPRGNYRVH